MVERREREGRDLLERSARGEEERTWRWWRPAKRGGEGRGGRRWGRRKRRAAAAGDGCVGVGPVAHPKSFFVRVEIYKRSGAFEMCAVLYY